MRRDKEFVDYVNAKTAELKKLLQENLLLDPEISQPGIEAAKAIVRELTGYGLYVRWSAKLQTLDHVEVKVEIFSPKPNLAPEDQRIYDEWFARMNDLPPPS